MFSRWICKPGIASLTSAILLAAAAAVAGCGGQPTDSSDVNVVLPDPSVNVSSKATPTAAPAGSGAVEAPSPGKTAAPAAATGGAEGWGTLKGHVGFEGNPPSPKVLQDKGKAEKDSTICAVDAPIVAERLVVDATTKGVKNVLVYLPRPSAVNDDARKAAAATKIEFDQKKCIFEPHVLGLMVGQTVTIKSSDPVNHNVNVKLKQSSFNNIVVAAQPQKFSLAGAERTPGMIICDIHPWMSAWWMVVDNPYIAVTDEKGNFEIKNVPAGAQKVVVWQEAVKGGGFVTPPSGQDVSIKAGDATVQEFKIDSTKLLPPS
jgi:plastocyanin